MSAAEDVRLAPATAGDRAFLFEVFAGTRAEELAAVPWSEAQKAALLRMQFEAQDRDYRASYPNAQFLLIYHQELPVGRLYLNEGEGEILVIDISLLPEARGKGLGSALLRGVMARAAATLRSVGLQVAQHNPARRLYEQLGFVPVSETDMYVRMQWRAH